MECIYKEGQGSGGKSNNIIGKIKDREGKEVIIYSGKPPCFDADYWRKRLEDNDRLIREVSGLDL